MAYEIKELSVGGILDQAIRIVKDHFGLLFGIVAVAFLPAMLLLNYLTPLFPWDFFVNQERMQAYVEATQAAQPYTLPLSLLVGYVIIPITNAAVIWAVAKVYLGEPASIGDAFRRAFKMLLPLVVTSFLYFLAIMIGSLLCLIPGLLFMFWFCLNGHVVIIEGIWGPKALSRSRALVKGSFGTAFVLGFMIFIIQMFVSVGTVVVGLKVIQVLISTIVSSIVMVFLTTVGVVFYFSCRCKTENFDLNVLAESVAREAA